MNFIKKLFCRHSWVLKAKRVSNYVSDWQTFSDSGWYDDLLYVCSKCGKSKIVTKPNKSHPLHHEWVPVNGGESNES